MSAEARLGAVAALDALAAGTVSAVELVDALLARCEQRADLHAFIAVDAEGARAAAREADRVRATGAENPPLLGLPFAVKDNIEAAGLATTAGTPALARWRPPADAPVVDRVRRAGAILLGKTNLHELGIGVTSGNAIFGAVRNPSAPARVAGGSSGGSAAAVAAGLVPVALATDTGGSARIPAALCGVVGLRPTHGRYPSGGTVPLSATRDTPGVIARSVDDVALLDAQLAGATARRRPAAASLRGVRLAIPRAFFFEQLDPAVQAAVEAALESLERQGVELVQRDVERVRELDAAAGVDVAFYEIARDLGGYTCRAAGIGFDALVPTVASADVRRVLEAALAEPVDEDSYAAALGRVAELRDAYARALDGVDALAFPTVPLPAPPLGDDEETTHLGRRVRTFPTLSRLTSPGSLAGVPGITLPVPVDAGALPVGLELEGTAGTDAALLALAGAVERGLRR